MADALVFSSVHRSFGSVRAVADLSFTAPSGSTTVLLGPNGAGKTTSVRLATGALEADSGRIRLLGLDPRSEGGRIRLRCGVIPPKPAFYDGLTGRENLAFAAALFGTSAEAVSAATARFGIRDALDQAVAGYSTGMRTRLALARAILHEPEILLLDEPTAGLDPESSRAVLDLIGEMAGRGRSIVMCTHLLYEAESIADHIILMNGGSARVSGPVAELAGRYMQDPVVLFEAENPSVFEGLDRMEGVRSVSPDASIRVTLDTMDRLPDIVAALVGRGARLTRVEPLRATLADLYFEMQRAHGDKV